MSNYNTILQGNNSSLEEIITKLNEMPDAGDGGGGENSVDVCTINIQSAYALNEIYASRCVQGMLLGGNVLDAPDQSTFTIPNVICGSIFFIYIAATGMSFTSVTGGATIIRGAGSPLIIKAPTTAGATATVNIMSD